MYKQILADSLKVINLVSDIEDDFHAHVLDDVFDIFRVNGACEVHIDLVSVADALSSGKSAGEASTLTVQGNKRVPHENVRL